MALVSPFVSFHTTIVCSPHIFATVVNVRLSLSLSLCVCVSFWIQDTARFRTLARLRNSTYVYTSTNGLCPGKSVEEDENLSMSSLPVWFAQCINLQILSNKAPPVARLFHTYTHIHTRQHNKSELDLINTKQNQQQNKAKQSNASLCLDKYLHRHPIRTSPPPCVIFSSPSLRFFFPSRPPWLRPNPVESRLPDTSRQERTT